jgi:hypothetical protein|tara:strand:- start:1476 stop:1673 length:198 start_codon:yes stop_codon:yes gene_type:complete
MLENVGWYFESLFNESLAFVFGWEAFVFFMLLFFISIVIRLNRLENKVDTVQETIMEIYDEEIKW